VFHEDFDARVDALVLEAADDLQPGAVADVAEAAVAVGPEGPLVDETGGSAIEDRPPTLQLQDTVAGLPGEDLGHPPVVDALAPLHGVGEVDLPVVFGVHVAQARRDPTLG